MLTNKLVSILIPVYNAENWLEETIQSALNQAWDNTEIIIVDDGSTDNSPEIARSFASDKVQVISQKNAGAAAARNRAFAASKGYYIQKQDADDLLAPEKIEKQMVRLQKESETTVASGPFDYFTGEPVNRITKADHAYRDYKNPLDWLVESMQKQDMFPPLVWLTPRP
ncbi:MAG: glycosyltransferase family 2 protein, partial [Bacteroidetes bacterium]